MIPSNNDLRFEVTTVCNYDCCICPRKEMTRQGGTMSLDLFRSLFDKVVKETGQYDTVSFAGMGEPLLDSTFDEKIKYVKNTGKTFRVLLVTNGSALSVGRFKELKEAGVDSIRVSFYGTDAEIYSRVHGTKDLGQFRRVKDNMTAISGIRGNVELIFTLNVIEGINDKTIREWIEFWEPKADLVEVWSPHNWVYGKKFRKLQNKKMKTCGRPFLGPLQVQVDGTVIMCCFDFDGKITLGDLKTSTLKEIFSSEIYEHLKKCHETGDFAKSGFICGSCDLRNSDKTDVMIYNSKFDISDRVNVISTTYTKVTGK